jgi:hypothetical protein
MIYSKDDPMVLEAIQFFKEHMNTHISTKQMGLYYGQLAYKSNNDVIIELYSIFGSEKKDCLDYIMMSEVSINILDYKPPKEYSGTSQYYDYSSWWVGVHKDGLRIMRERKALENDIKLDCDKALEEVLTKRL